MCKRRIGTILFSLILILVLAHPVSAMGERLYDKGRAESSILDGQEVGKSTFVISASAIYYPDHGWGTENLRVWGRNESIRQFYPTPFYQVAGVTWAHLRLFVDCGEEPRCRQLTGVVAEPVADQKVRYWEAIFYDILGYGGIPTSTIQAIINGLYASSVVDQPYWHDTTVKLQAGDLSAFPEAQTSLKSTTPYGRADAAEAGVSSGLGARFNFHLTRSDTNFRVWPQGMISYLVWRENCTLEGACISVPFRVESGAAGVRHRLNTQ